DDREVEPAVPVEIEPLRGLHRALRDEPAAGAHVGEDSTLVVEEPARALARAHEEVQPAIAVVVGPQRERDVRDLGQAEPLGHVLEATLASVREELQRAVATHGGEVEATVAIEVTQGEERRDTAL